MMRSLKNLKINNNIFYKMRHIKLIFPVVALFIIISSCRKTIEPKDLPQQDPRLVLNCVMYPDSQIMAEISVSKSILSSKEYKYITDATCELYENDTYIEKLTSIGSGKYRSNSKATVNKNYTVKVIATGYNGVSGSSALPLPMVTSAIDQYDTTISKYTITSYRNGPNTFAYAVNGSTKYRFVIKDDVTTRNFYNIRAVGYIIDSSGTREPILNTTLRNNINSINGSGYSYYGIDLDDASVTNGNEIKADLMISFYQNLPADFKLKTVEVYLLLYTFSPEYFRYMSTLNNQEGSTGSLFSEPVQIYSNVNNGMGIVAGATISKVQVYSKDIAP